MPPPPPPPPPPPTTPDPPLPLPPSPPAPPATPPLPPGGPPPPYTPGWLLETFYNVECGTGAILDGGGGSGRRRRLVDPCDDPDLASWEYTQVDFMPFCTTCPPACKARNQKLLSKYIAYHAGETVRTPMRDMAIYSERPLPRVHTPHIFTAFPTQSGTELDLLASKMELNRR